MIIYYVPIVQYLVSLQYSVGYSQADGVKVPNVPLGEVLAS